MEIVKLPKQAIKKIKKKSRSKFFHIFIRPRLYGQVLRELTKDDIRLIFQMIKFLKVATLDTILQDLIITDRGRKIQIEKYLYQMEQPEQFETPYWRIILQTSAVTTGLSLKRALQNEIDQRSQEIILSFLRLKLFLLSVIRAVEVVKNFIKIK